MDYKEIQERLLPINAIIKNLATRKIQLETQLDGIKKDLTDKYTELSAHGITSIEEAKSRKEELESSIKAQLADIEPNISKAKELLNNDSTSI